jgi:hypothetical protein
LQEGANAATEEARRAQTMAENFMVQWIEDISGKENRLAVRLKQEKIATLKQESRSLWLRVISIGDPPNAAGRESGSIRYSTGFQILWRVIDK